MSISMSELQAFIDATYLNAGWPADAKKVILPKWYGFTQTAIGVGTTVTQQIQIAANGDFFCTGLVFKASLAGAAMTVSTVPIPNVRMVITDTGTDEQWFNQALDMNLIGDVPGSGGHDMDFKFPRVIAGRSTVTVQLTSYEAVNTPVVDFALVGVLVKMLSQPSI